MTAADGPSYDLVIVGAGASACGLLYGILLRHILHSGGENDNDEHKQQAPVQPLPFTIAVLDRGTTSSCGGTGTCSIAPSSSSSYPAYRTNPSDWFRASHGNDGFIPANRSPTLLQTRPQVGLGNRIVEVPIGDGLGGSTNINACLVATPSQHDFDEWPDEFSGSKMVDAAIHISGMMGNSDAIELTKFSNDCACDGRPNRTSSLDPAQFPSQVDRLATSSRKSRGCNIRARVNYHDSLVRPLLDEHPQLRQHVTFLEGFDVQRIFFERGCSQDGNSTFCRAAGVDCNVVTGGSVQIRARRELFLCTGAIFSPALLMVSGIGPSDVISNLGVSLPAYISTQPSGWNMVGKGLTDHVVLPRAFLTLPGKWRNKSISGILTWYNAKDEQSLYQLAITDGICSTQLIPHFVAAFFRRHGSGAPSGEQKKRNRAWAGIVDLAWAYTYGIVRFVLHFLLFWTPLGLIVKHCTATINISLLNPVSRGCVAIQRRGDCCSTSSSSPRLDEFNIIVDPAYLTDARDVKAIERGWKLSEIVRAKHFAVTCLEVLPSFVYRHMFPFAKRFLDFFYFGTDQKKWFFQFASDFSCPYFHWNGTCAMGSHNTSTVVNSQLEVVGVKGLRVCDASVFPSHVSCPPALTCASLGYVASGYIHSELY
jgi:hypothetical protein